MSLELGGKITIECEKTKYSAELEFKLKVLIKITPLLIIVRFPSFFKLSIGLISCLFQQPFLGSSCNVNQVSGKIRMGEDMLATVEGHWVLR